MSGKTNRNWRKFNQNSDLFYKKLDDETPNLVRAKTNAFPPKPERVAFVANELPEFGIVNTVSLKLRIDPSVKAGIRCYLVSKTKVTILSIEENWTKVKMVEDPFYEGYVASQYLDLLY